MKVRKAVIAAAGFGTRFLPQTKAMPKEMLPIVDKPIIQYIVEELVEAGIEDVMMVTGYHKRSVEDHFDHMSADLRENLKRGGKLKLLEETKHISDLANFVYVRQKGPYGNATPIINVEHLIGDEPFIYTFADDFIVSEPSSFSQLVSAYQSKQGHVLTCIKRDRPEDYKKYGYVTGKSAGDGLTAVEQIIEKPGSAEAAHGSTLASVSGYIFEPKIFDYLREDLKNLESGKEFIMQNALQRMIGDGESVWAQEIKGGKYYDTGDKLEYIKTVVDFALEHEDIADDVISFLKSKFER